MSGPGARFAVAARQERLQEARAKLILEWRRRNAARVKQGFSPLPEPSDQQLTAGAQFALAHQDAINAGLKRGFTPPTTLKGLRDVMDYAVGKTSTPPAGWAYGEIPKLSNVGFLADLLRRQTAPRPGEAQPKWWEWGLGLMGGLGEVGKVSKIAEEAARAGGLTTEERTLFHYAHQPLDVIDPAMAGSNPMLRGAERAREDRVPSSFFYTAPRKPEVGVGQIPHQVKAKGAWLNVEDLPKPLQGVTGTALERAAKDAGYTGLEQPSRGIVSSFYPMKAEPMLDAPAFERRLNPALRAKLTEIAQMHAGANGQEVGSTVDPRTGQPVTSGYVVSPFKQAEFPIPGRPSQQRLEESLRLFLARNAELFKDPRNQLGTWYNPAANEHVWDVVQVHPNTPTGRATAMGVGRAAKQQAIFHLDRMQTLPVPDLIPPTAAAWADPQQLETVRLTKPLAQLSDTELEQTLGKVQANQERAQAATARGAIGGEHYADYDMQQLEQELARRTGMGAFAAAGATQQQQQEGGNPGIIPLAALSAAVMPSRGDIAKVIRRLEPMVELGRNYPGAVDWYPSFRNQAMQDLFGPDLPRFAGVTAAVSPQTRWISATGREDNIDLARRAYRALQEQVPFQTYIKNFPAHISNLERVRAGEPLSGRKAWSFDQNFLGNYDPTTVETVLRVGSGFGPKNTILPFGQQGLPGSISPYEYRVIDRALQTMAPHFSLTPAQTQSAAWSGVKHGYADFLPPGITAAPGSIIPAVINDAGGLEAWLQAARQRPYADLLQGRLFP